MSIADAQALPILRQALEALDPETQVREVARATLALGRHCYLRAEYADALGYMERARQLLEPLDDAETLRFVYHYMADALILSARFEQSSSWLKRLIDLGEARHLPSSVAVGYWYRAFIALYQGNWQEAHDYGGHGLALAQTLALHSNTDEVWSAIPVAYAAYYQGDLARGARTARACVERATKKGDRRAVLYAARILIQFETAAGAEDIALARGRTAVHDADQLTEVPLRCWIRLALGGLYRQREEWELALALYTQCADLVAGTESRLVHMELGAALAETYCALGRHAEAAKLIDQTLAQTQASGARHFEAVAWRVKGRLHADQRAFDDAAIAFDQAVAICEILGNRLELAHALCGRGTLYLAHSRLEAAQADLTRATELCEQVGARALLWSLYGARSRLAVARQHVNEAEHMYAAARTVVDDLLATMAEGAAHESLGRRAAAQLPTRAVVASLQASKPTAGGLTGREREVAALIAQGYSNREIATALIISERTVTTHISNIFAKLGFSTRAQVAAWISEQGLTHQPHDTGYDFSAG